MSGKTVMSISESKCAWRLDGLQLMEDNGRISLPPMVLDLGSEYKGNFTFLFRRRVPVHEQNSVASSRPTLFSGLNTPPVPVQEQKSMTNKPTLFSGLRTPPVPVQEQTSFFQAPPSIFGNKEVGSESEPVRRIHQDQVEMILNIDEGVVFSDASGTKLTGIHSIIIKVRAVYSLSSDPKNAMYDVRSKTITSKPSHMPTTVETITIKKTSKDSWESVNLEFTAVTRTTLHSLEESSVVKDQKPVLSTMSSMIHDLKILFETKEHADIILQVNDTSIPAHRLVLACRSPAFAALLKDGSDTIDIKDMSVDVLQELLRYFYTDEIQQFELSLELVKVAKSQNITYLVNMCKEHLKTSMSLENCVECLVVGNDFKIEDLKTVASRFIIRNMKQVKELKQWQGLATNHPSLVAELCVQIWT